MAQTFIKAEGLNKLISKFRRRERGVLSEQIMGEIATYLIQAILRRTEQGVGADRQHFKPYHPKYRLFREETGHQGTPVNLHYTATGGMLSSMTFKATAEQAEIFFMPTSVPGQKVTNPQKAFYNQQSRDFFGISVHEQDQIREMVREYIHNILRD